MSQTGRAPVGELGWGALLQLALARAILSTLASLVLWSLLPGVGGLTPRLIMSGSMEPRIHTGDVLMTRPVPSETLARGQVVTVLDPDHPGHTRTHRLVRREGSHALVTRGDANPQDDSSRVADSDVLGVAVVRVPYVGLPVLWLELRRWVPLGATFLVLGWALFTVLPRRRRPTAPGAGPGDAPGDGSDGEPPTVVRRRRSVALARTGLLAVVVVVGPVAGPATAGFLKASANATSSLNAASTFYPYRTAVLADTPYLYWRLAETSGTAVSDAGASARAGTVANTGYTWGTTSPLLSETRDRGLSLTTCLINVNSSVASPTAFSVEAWVKSSSTTGGRILGFGNQTGTTTSTTIDRQLYLAPTGKVYFGVGSAKTVVASTASVANGAWHHVVGTFTTGSNGMKLYVDGTLQGQTAATAQSFTGYWRAGGETMSGWTGNPSDGYYDGDLDELAVYTTALTATRVLAHYNAGITP